MDADALTLSHWAIINDVLEYVKKYNISSTCIIFDIWILLAFNRR